MGAEKKSGREIKEIQVGLTILSVFFVTIAARRIEFMGRCQKCTYGFN